MKGWKTVALYVALMGGALGANALGIVPKPTPGWLLISGTLLLAIGGAVLDKARRILSEDGLAAALEEIVMAAAIFNGAIGCLLVGFFSGAAS